MIPVIIQEEGGRFFSYNAMIDTGFSGYLTLPLITITTLHLNFVGPRFFSLGNRTRVSFDTYEASVRWDGGERDVVVLASETYALVGMSLLKGFRVTFDAVDGGEVRIERRA